MAAIANFSCCLPKLYHNCLPFSKPISFRALPPPLSIKASASSFDHEKPFVSPLVKSASIATVTVIAAATVFFARSNLKFSIAKSQTTSKENIRENADTNPNEVQVLRNLMKSKVNNQEMEEAIGIVTRLIKLEPQEQVWPLVKAHLHCQNGDIDIAKKEFNEIALKHPRRVEVYHGLVIVALRSGSESGQELKLIEKRATNAMKMEMEIAMEQMKNLKLLVAQIAVIEGDYSGALKVYQELINDEPRDFRPYLCQAIVYTLMGQEKEAEKQFQKYGRLVPQGNQYAEYFHNNMMMTKQLSEKIEGAKRN